jgi:hypothetical protein
VSLDDEEFARGLIFVGSDNAYRAGPLRSQKLRTLRELAEHSR